MLPIQEFRESLPNPEKYNDGEIERIDTALEELADILFDRWLRARGWVS